MCWDLCRLPVSCSKKCNSSSLCRYSDPSFLPLLVFRTCSATSAARSFSLQPGCFSRAFYCPQGHTWAVGRPLLCQLEGSEPLLLSANLAWLFYVQSQDYSPVNLSPDPRGRKPGHAVRVSNPCFHPVWNVFCVQMNARKGSDLCAFRNAW